MRSKLFIIIAKFTMTRSERSIGVYNQGWALPVQVRMARSPQPLTKTIQCTTYNIQVLFQTVRRAHARPAPVHNPTCPHDSAGGHPTAPSTAPHRNTKCQLRERCRAGGRMRAGPRYDLTLLLAHYLLCEESMRSRCSK